MPSFHYTAKRGPTEVIEGTVEAENRTGVLTYLAALGYVPVRVKEEAAVEPMIVTAQPPEVKVGRGRVPTAQLTLFTRQFASLVRSQVPLLRTLQILEEQTKQAYFRSVLRGVTEGVRQGQTLSSGLARFPDAFDPLYVSLVHSGEVSGALDAILEQLADQGEHDEALRAKVRAAYTYPVFVAVVGLCTVLFLMTFVMPRLSQLLLGLGEHLPLPTRLLLRLADWMSSGWFWGGAAILAATLTLAWNAAGERGRRARDRLLLYLPLFGPLVKEAELARFARAFGLLIHHGVSVLHAMEVAIPVVKHRLIRAELERLPEGLRQGNALSTCLKSLSISNPFLVNTVAVGEEGGRVGEALTEVAVYYERSVERSLQTMATLLEPTLIVVVGLIVGFIVIAVLLPIFEMSTLSR